MQDAAPGREQRRAPRIDAVGHQVGEAAGLVGLLAHRDEDVRVDRGRAARRLVGIVGLVDRAAGDLGTLTRPGEARGVEVVPGWRRDRHVAAGHRGERDERSADVVAVAEVGESQAAQVAEALGQRLQVGERLARVLVVREPVDHGDRREARELVDV